MYQTKIIKYMPYLTLLHTLPLDYDISKILFLGIVFYFSTFVIIFYSSSFENTMWIWFLLIADSLYMAYIYRDFFKEEEEEEFNKKPIQISTLVFRQDC